MNLILLEREEQLGDGSFLLAGARASHVLNVLASRPGQSVRVGLVDGPRGIATLTYVLGDRVRLEPVFDETVPPRPAVDLLLALPRPKVMRRLWPQLAALGVGRIMLSNAERVERHYFDTHVLAPDFYRSLLLDGLSQARDTRVPEVSIHKRFRVLVEDGLDELCPGHLRLVAEPGSNMSVSARLRALVPAHARSEACRTGMEPPLHPASAKVLIAVGPEGGWNAFELKLLESHGFDMVSMGGRTLRSDTACVALLALVHAALQEGP